MERTNNYNEATEVMENGYGGMNGSILGGYVNQELVDYLAYGLEVFRRSDEINERFDQSDRSVKAAEISAKSVKTKWNILSIAGSIIVFSFVNGLFDGVLKVICDILIIVASLVACYYLRMRFMPGDIKRKNENYAQVMSDAETVIAEKQQMDAFIEYNYSSIPETYKGSWAFEYMLNLAKAGRIMNLNQGYQSVDDELYRQAILEEQKKAIEEQNAAVAGAAATVGAASVVGGIFSFGRFLMDI